MSQSTARRPSRKVGVLRFSHCVPFAFDAGDANFYRYALNSPTNTTDPSGLEEVSFTKSGWNYKFDVTPPSPREEERTQPTRFRSIDQVYRTAPIKAMDGRINGNIVVVSGVKALERKVGTSDYTPMKTRQGGSVEAAPGIYIAYVPNTAGKDKKEKDVLADNTAKVEWIQFYRISISWNYKIGDRRAESDAYNIQWYPPDGSGDRSSPVTSPVFFLDSAVKSSPVYSSGYVGNSNTERAFIFDPPGVQDVMAMDIAEKHKDNLVGADVVMLFTAYAVLDGKAFAQVDWHTSAYWGPRGVRGPYNQEKVPDWAPQGDPRAYWPTIDYAGPVLTGDKERTMHLKHKRNGPETAQKAQQAILDANASNYKQKYPSLFK
jgi:hypothetical protein